MEIAGGVGQACVICSVAALTMLSLPVADVHAPEAGERVEQFVAVDVAQEYAVCGVEDGDAARFVRAIADYRVDQVLAVGFDERLIRHVVSRLGMG